MNIQKILVVEDHDLMRLALIDELKATIDDCIVIGVQTATLALQRLAGETFDLVLVDPGLPDHDPTSRPQRIAFIARIVAASPKALHLVITGDDDPAEAEACKAKGVAAYIGKTGLERGFLARILSQTAAGQFLTCPSKAGMTVADMHYSGLTRREQEIVDLMTHRHRGTKRKAIYETMSALCGIDVSTAEKYFKQARVKLQKKGTLPKGL